MEIKKTPKADLEGKKSTNILIGCVLILASIFVAFEWTQRELKEVDNDPIFSVFSDEEIIPITQRQEILTAPAAAAPTVADIIEIIDNKVDQNDDIVPDSEDNNQAIVVGSGEGQPSTAGPPGPTVEAEDNNIYPVAEVAPMFPGGEKACYDWLRKNINYPSYCRENNIQGVVVCTFVVNKDGSIVDIKILKSPDPYLSREAERVLKIMPRWQPGRQQGRPVRVTFTLPIHFRFQ